MQTPITLPPDLAEDLENALDAAVGQLQFLGDPGESTGICIEAGESALKRYREARKKPQAAAPDPDPEYDRKNDQLRAGEIAEVMSAALRQFGGPLRLATICMEQAGDADLNALSRHHTLDLATAVDDWKTRAEARMIEFERSGTG